MSSAAGGGGDRGGGRSRTLAPLVAAGALTPGAGVLSCSVAGRDYFAGTIKEDPSLDRNSDLGIEKSGGNVEFFLARRHVVVLVFFFLESD